MGLAPVPNDQTGDDDDDIKLKLIFLPGSSEQCYKGCSIRGVVKCSEITSKVVGGGEEGMY